VKKLILRSITKIAVVLLVVSIFSSFAPTTLAAGTFVTTFRVNVRSQPSTGGDIVGVVDSGTNVDVSLHDPAGWSRVTFNGTTGYIRSDLLRFAAGGTFRTTAGVNVRSGPSTGAEVVDSLASGSSVEVTEHNPADWSRVSVNGVTGFIRSDFLTRSEPGTTLGTPSSEQGGQSQAAPAATTLLTTGNVNMRSGPSTQDDIVRLLPRGTSVQVTQVMSGGWSRVTHSGTNGYIRSDLLSDTVPQTSAASTTLRTTGSVNMRSGAATSYSRVSLLAPNTSVEVVENLSNGWSRVNHSGTTGFIRSDLLSAAGAPSQAVGNLTARAGARFRTGPSTDHSLITTFSVATTVNVLENRADGWSRVTHGGNTGYIFTELLGSSGSFQRIEWSEARRIIPTGRDIRIVDVRTGISFNIRAFSLGVHADVEPSTQADTDAMLRTRNGTWSWAARPVWVTIGERTFPAAMNGMPHGGTTISNNGVNGHFCLWFAGSRSTGSTSASYTRNMLNAVEEAWNARPR